MNCKHWLFRFFAVEQFAVKNKKNLTETSIFSYREKSVHGKHYLHEFIPPDIALLAIRAVTTHDQITLKVNLGTRRHAFQSDPLSSEANLFLAGNL